MKRLYGLVLWAMCCLGALPSSVVAARSDALLIPDHYALINDCCDVLPLATRYRLLDKLRALEKQNGTQIVVLVVPSTAPVGSQAYAERVFEQWNLGNNGEGNGVLFLLSGDDSAYIRTGAGIAGALPDARLKQIFAQTETLWQAQKTPEAIEAVVDLLIHAAQGEQTQPTFYDYRRADLSPRYMLAGALSLVIVAYLGWLLWRRTRRRGLRS